jgi:hypothetical protein
MKLLKEILKSSFTERKRALFRILGLLRVVENMKIETQHYLHLVSIIMKMKARVAQVLV